MNALASSRRDRRMWIGFGVVLLLALVPRLFLALAKSNRIYFGDTYEYQEAARSLLAGHGPGVAFPRAPLYPALMALGFLLFGDGNYTAVRLLQLPLGIAIVAMCWLLAARIGRPQHGALAGLLAAASPTLVFTAEMLYPTALYTALLLAITWVALELDRRPGPGRGAALGILLTAVFLVDAVALAPMAAVLLWLAWGIRRRGRRLLLALAVALATAVLTVVPVLRFYGHAYGQAPIFMEKAQAVLWMVRHDPQAGRTVHDTTPQFASLGAGGFVRRELHLLWTQPAAYLKDYGSEFVHFFNPMPDRITTRNVYTGSASKLVTGAYFVPVLLLALVGLFAGAASRRERLLLCAVPLAADALYSLFFTQLRYRVPVEPHLMILAALGAARLFPRLSDAVAGRVIGPQGASPPAPASAAARAAAAGVLPRQEAPL